MDENYFVQDEHLKDRLNYAEGLVTYLMRIEDDIKEIRKIIGYEVINECLTPNGFVGKSSEWAARGKEPCDLYFILNEEKTLVKIGISKNANGRIKEMQTATGYYLELLNVIHFPTREEASYAEAWLHRHYSVFRRHPVVKKTSEWFEADIVNDLMMNYSTLEGIRRAIDDEMKKAKAIADKLGARFEGR